VDVSRDGQACIEHMENGGMTQQDNSAAPRVTVWRELLLPLSETFILSQITNLEHYVPTVVGLRRAEQGLNLDAIKSYIPAHGKDVRRVLGSKVGRHLTWKKLARRALESDVNHVHFLTDAALFYPIFRRLSVPLVVSCHGYDVTRSNQHLRRGGASERALSFRRAAVFDRCDRLIAVSNFVADELQRLGAPARKIDVSPIGVPVNLPAKARELKYDVAFVGRLVEKKGCVDLIRAIASIDRSLSVCVIGTGPEEPRIRSLAHELRVEVKFLGAQGHTAVQDVLSRSRIFVGPSRRGHDGDAEGFGLVFLEAARACLPAVAYTSGGVPEAVLDGVTGILCPEGDIAALGQAVDALLRNPKLAAELGSAGQMRVAQLFDVRKRTEDLERIYDSVRR
jgi:colanic acid/amylovoran biosynthesis glycosyltransferase